MILDPCLGIQWQLRSDPLHPGGPAQLVQVGRDAVSSIRPISEGVGTTVIRDHSAYRPAPIVVHAGETIVVEQDSAVLHAHLLAIALASATLGQIFPARLKPIRGFAASANSGVVSVTATGVQQARWSAPDRLPERGAL